MATAPKTVGHKQPKQTRPNAYRRGYATKRYQRQRIAYLQRIVVETGRLDCGICGGTLLNEDDINITIDHIVPPLHYGGYGTAAYDRAFHDEDNWQPAHRRCNSAKQDREGHP